MEPLFSTRGPPVHQPPTLRFPRAPLYPHPPLRLPHLRICLLSHISLLSLLSLSLSLSLSPFLFLLCSHRPTPSFASLPLPSPPPFARPLLVVRSSGGDGLRRTE